MIHWTIDGKLRKGESCYMNLIGGSKYSKKNKSYARYLKQIV